MLNPTFLVFKIVAFNQTPTGKMDMQKLHRRYSIFEIV